MSPAELSEPLGEWQLVGEPDDTKAEGRAPAAAPSEEAPSQEAPCDFDPKPCKSQVLTTYAGSGPAA